MSTDSTDTPGSADSRSRPRRALSSIAERGRDGSLAMLGGGAMLAWALRSRTDRGGGALKPLAAVALAGLGMRQRRARQAGGVETGADARRDERGEKKVSDEARAHRGMSLGAGRNADEATGDYRSGEDVNPRGLTDREDAQRDDGGDVDFVVGKEPGTHRQTHLEDEDAHDPRIHPDEDRQTEVDLSTASMADEASEAAGPHAEQSYPALEGTDPEPMSNKAPPRVGEGAVSPAGPESRDEVVDEEPDRATGDEDREGRRDLS